jgi:hypothetical protein
MRPAAFIQSRFLAGSSCQTAHQSAAKRSRRICSPARVELGVHAFRLAKGSLTSRKAKHASVA